MDEEEAVSPAPPGTGVSQARVVRAARHVGRHDGRDDGTPLRPDREYAMPWPVEQSGEGEREPGNLRVAVRREGPARVVSVVGELDHGTANGLWTVRSRPAAEGGERIVVDLADLRFGDSTGLNILLRARRDAEAAGLRLELAGPRPTMARLFAITEADSVLRIHPDLDAALKATDPSPGIRDGRKRGVRHLPEVRLGRRCRIGGGDRARDQGTDRGAGTGGSVASQGRGLRPASARGWGGGSAGCPGPGEPERSSRWSSRRRPQRPSACASSRLFIFERPLMLRCLASLYSWS
ncbi:STAS domain-containing protein [Kitasatospora sp. NPDC087314]|uniref:STAS domain-containing protein n=1 Tax=Kitasatospora sp. NPDC087314 TaxID=3364068 RepID=UPI0038134E96